MLKSDHLFYTKTSLSLRNSEVHEDKCSAPPSWSSSHSSTAHRFWLGQVLPQHHSVLQEEGGGGHHQLHAPRGLQPGVPSVQNVRHLQVQDFFCVLNWSFSETFRRPPVNLNTSVGGACFSPCWCVIVNVCCSYGVLLWSIITGQHPYPSESSSCFFYILKHRQIVIWAHTDSYRKCRFPSFSFLLYLHHSCFGL